MRGQAKRVPPSAGRHGPARRSRVCEMTSSPSSGSPQIPTSCRVPCIRGSRYTVATVVAMVSDGMSVEEIVTELPDLVTDDVTEALRYAAEAVRERELPLRHTA